MSSSWRRRAVIGAWIMLTLGIAGIVVRVAQTDMLDSAALPSVREWQMILDSYIVAGAAVCIGASVVLFAITALAGFRNTQIQSAEYVPSDALAGDNGDAAMSRHTSERGRSMAVDPARTVRPENSLDRKRAPAHDLYSGGLGITIGVAIYFFFAQNATDQLAASGEQASETFSNNVNLARMIAILFIVAGLYYVAKGLLRQAQPSAPESDAGRPFVECPQCREQIRQGAVKCRFCGAEQEGA